MKPRILGITGRVHVHTVLPESESHLSLTFLRFEDKLTIFPQHDKWHAGHLSRLYTAVVRAPYVRRLHQPIARRSRPRQKGPALAHSQRRMKLGAGALRTR
jgi:hypothetical protein